MPGHGGVEQAVVGTVVVDNGDPLADQLLNLVEIQHRLGLRGHSPRIDVGALVSGKVLQQIQSQCQEEPL